MEVSSHTRWQTGATAILVVIVLFLALYNLENDPGERHNIASKEPERTALMQKKIIDYVQNTKPRWSFEDDFELSAEEIQQMKNLGYMN